jgi:hypothetical protein
MNDNLLQKIWLASKRNKPAKYSQSHGHNWSSVISELYNCKLSRVLWSDWVSTSSKRMLKGSCDPSKLDFCFVTDLSQLLDLYICTLLYLILDQQYQFIRTCNCQLWCVSCVLSSWSRVDEPYSNNWQANVVFSSPVICCIINI